MNIIYASSPGDQPPATNIVKKNLYVLLKKLGLHEAQYSLFLPPDETFIVIADSKL